MAALKTKEEIFIDRFRDAYTDLVLRETKKIEEEEIESRAKASRILRGEEIYREKTKIRRLKEYRKKYSEKQKAEGKHLLKRKYGKSLSFHGRDKLIQDQLGLCEICKNQLINPHVDHCHATQGIRGILCAKCNVGLGKFGDDPTKLEAAAAYLRLYELYGTPKI